MHTRKLSAFEDRISISSSFLFPFDILMRDRISRFEIFCFDVLSFSSCFFEPKFDFYINSNIKDKKYNNPQLHSGFIMLTTDLLPLLNGKVPPLSNLISILSSFQASCLLF